MMEWCCQKAIKPLYNDINENDYFEPIKRYSNENNNVFEEIIKTNKITDDVIHFYIKSMKNISIIVIYPKAIRYDNLMTGLIEKLSLNGKIHYTKDININYYSAYNLIYQLYATDKRMKLNDHIQYKLNRLGFNNDNELYPIKIIVYSLTNKTTTISGSGASFKTELRDIFVKEDIKATQFKETEDSYPRGYDYIHASDNDNQSYEYAGIFFNKNSLRFLKKQQSWKILDMIQTIKKFNKVKEFFYNYSQKELEKFIIFSSGVLFSYGVREVNDIDGLLMPSSIPAEMIEKLNNETIDISYEGLKIFNDRWMNKLNSRAKLFGVDNFYTLIIDPKYHYYFMGLKFLRLKYELIVRYDRGRPAQFADLLVMKHVFNLKYDLVVPEETKQLDKKTMIVEHNKVNMRTYINTIKFYLQKRYYINLTVEQIEEWIKQKLLTNKMKTPTTEINEKNIIYPTQAELINMGYEPNMVIYADDKPFLYPGENFKYTAVTNYCQRTIKEVKPKIKNSLRVMTFNVHNFITRCNHGIAPIFSSINPFQKARDITKFLELIKSTNIDILCLQEVVPVPNFEIKEDIKDYDFIRKHFTFDFLNDEMKKLGFKYNIIAPTQHGKFNENENRTYYFLANAIYSKRELLKTEIDNFDYLNRNIIKTEVNFNGKNIIIVNTHLEYFGNNVIRQYQNLKTHIDSSNTILCGDFNIDLFNNHKSKRYDQWEEKTNFIRNNYISANKSTLITNFSQGEQTDFILLNKKSDIKNIYSYVIFTYISDHYPVIADFV